MEKCNSLEIKKGPFTILPQEGLVISGKQKRNLQPKHMEVLLVLLHREGQVVSLDEIHQKVWPEVHVGSNTLQRCIATLRTAFDDDAKRQDVIQTFPKRGYRFQVHLKPTQKRKALGLWMTPFVLVGIIFLVGRSPAPHRIEVKHIDPISVSNGQESLAVYASHQPWVAFLRDEEHCEKSIWIKDLAGQVETRVPIETQDFTGLAWSKKGVLAYQNRSCSESPNSCNGFGLLFFEDDPDQAVPLDISAMIPSGVGKFDWWEDDLAFVDNSLPGLVYLDWQNASIRSVPLEYFNYIHDVDVYEGTPHILAKKDSRLVLAKLVGETIRVLHSNLMAKTSHFAEWDLEIHQKTGWFMVFSGNRTHLFRPDGIPFQGPHSSGFSIFPSDFHPRDPLLLGSLALFDWDVLESGWSSGAPQNSVFGTSASEFFFKYGPENWLALTSERTGIPQIWVYDGRNLRMLSSFNTFKSIGSLAWSLDGQELFSVVDDQLVSFKVTSGEQKFLSKSMEVMDILQTLPDGLLMRNYSSKGPYVGLWQENTTEILYEGPFRWAQKVGPDLLLSIEHDLFLLREDQLTKLSAPGPLGKFLVLNDTIFADCDRGLYEATWNGGSLVWNKLGLKIDGKLMDIHPERKSVAITGLIRQDRDLVQMQLEEVK